MVANIFELFMGYFGNGITVCNKEVLENGDYKKIAHISEHGHVEFYVPVDYIPFKKMAIIRQAADREKQKFIEVWNKKTLVQKYAYMMELPTIGCGYNAIQLVEHENRHLPLEERVGLMEKMFFETHM